MSKYLSVLALLLSSFALGAATPSVAAAAGTGQLQTQQARFGGSFRARPTFRSRYRSPGYGYRRSHPLRGLGGSILRALGLAYLFHLLFGWGGGGSPLGLLLLVALVAWLVTRGRRGRPVAY